MNPISPKVSAASGAAGGSTPLSIIVIWALGQAGLQVPAEVAIAIAGVIATGAALLFGYLVPGNPQPPHNGGAP